jgi:mono/diheme cytochrome c family protein
MGKREWLSLVAAVMLAACGGDAGDAGTEMGDTAAPGATTSPGTTPPGPTTTAGTPPTGGTTGAALPPGVTPAMVAQGKTIFESTAPCYTCHGADGSGTPLAPNLRDATWINTDGTLQGIETVVRTGVPQPKQHPAPMPAMGGAQLNNEQVRAVAAYVYSISHGG